MFFNFNSKNKDFQQKLDELNLEFEAKIAQLQEDSKAQLEEAFATITIKDAEIDQLKDQLQELKNREAEIKEAITDTDEKIEEIAEIKATEILSNVGHEPVNCDLNTDEGVSIEELFKDYQKNRNKILNLINE